MFQNGESSDTAKEDGVTTASDVTESKEDNDNQDNKENTLQVTENRPKNRI